MQSLWRMWKDDKSDESIWLWENEPYKIQGTCYTLKGWSRAALRTNFYIPELRVMLDAGLSSNISPDYILITHCHSDHTASIPFYLYTRHKKIAIFSPPESYERIDNYIKSLHFMSANIDDEDLLDVAKLYDMIPAYEGETEILIGEKSEEYTDSNGNKQVKYKGGKPMKVEIIKCDHGVPCVGYGLIENRIKLKPEYEHLQGKEIGVLKKLGIDINYKVDFPFFCYLGDTSHEVLKDKRIEKYLTLMIECTFILPDEHNNAILTKHIHWEYLKPYVLTHPNTNFILYHFSQRYKPEQIKEFFDNEFFDKESNEIIISNVKVWISS
jgi:ribonuclease Z